MDSIGNNCCLFAFHVIYIFGSRIWTKSPTNHFAFIIGSFWAYSKQTTRFHPAHVLFLEFGGFFGISRLFFHKVYCFFCCCPFQNVKTESTRCRSTYVRLGQIQWKNPQVPLHIDYRRTLCGYSIRLHTYIVSISRHKIYVPLSVCVYYDGLHVCDSLV